MRLFQKLFGKKIPVPPSVGVDWASIIYSYVTNLHGSSYDSGREDKARKKYNDRGLAFGAVRIVEGGGHSVKIALLKPGSDVFKKVRRVLSRAIDERGLAKQLTVTEDSFGDVVAVIDDEESETLRGRWVSGFSQGESFQRKEFLSIGRHDGMEAYSEEALRVLLVVTTALGCTPDAKHYSYESTVQIEEIITYAVRWEDSATGKKYLDVVWNPDLVKHLVYHGSNCGEERKEGDLRGEVLASMGDYWPKISINNRPVYSTIVHAPTDAMLAAKQKIAERSVRRCDCGELAANEITLVRFESTDTFGGTSMGGITYACSESTCLEKAKAQDCIRADVRPYEQEVWL